MCPPIFFGLGLPMGVGPGAPESSPSLSLEAGWLSATRKMLQEAHQGGGDSATLPPLPSAFLPGEGLSETQTEKAAPSPLESWALGWPVLPKPRPGSPGTWQGCPASLVDTVGTVVSVDYVTDSMLQGWGPGSSVPARVSLSSLPSTIGGSSGTARLSSLAAP